MSTQPRYTFYPDVGVEAEIPRRGILSQTLSSEDGVELILFAMAAGEQLSEHTSARPAIIHVLSGEGTLTVDGVDHPIGPNSWLRMPIRTPHALLARTSLTFALYLLPT